MIGSGVGGLTAAAVLAKLGKKVLVLEQNDQAGGLCQTFTKEGFEFDSGEISFVKLNNFNCTKDILNILNVST